MRAQACVAVCLILAAALLMTGAGAAGTGGARGRARMASPLPMPACPVTQPNDVQPPPEANIFGRGNGDYGTDALWTSLWVWGEGTVVVPPTHVQADGVLGPMKWPWWRGVPGQLVIEGRRIDATAPPLQTYSAAGQRLDQPEPTPSAFDVVYTETAFLPTGLVFPTTGCWEITASVGEERLTFVTLVVLAEEIQATPGAMAALE